MGKVYDIICVALTHQRSFALEVFFFWKQHSVLGGGKYEDTLGRISNVNVQKKYSEIWCKNYRLFSKIVSALGVNEFGVILNG